ncbi:hypothetical protein BFJ68_g14146 [Fusarium oxysporum]|uniref:Uncharacterized protein n=1 Tax=Fusarium oxysporum TaxID=5507 RepID=A0A420PXC1_FUSOX|nr:hypothetical protein BFJ68_g14146 [Fusarium oxysporum]
MTNLIANPPKNTTDLDLILQELSAQAGVIRALFSIEKCLEGDIPHHLKYERLRPILKFIHAEPSNKDARENERRETLAKLDDNSRALCGIALTLNKIKALSDSTIDALRTGLPHFITKRGLSELIETKLGSFVRRTTEEFANPTIRFVYGMPSKRQKVYDSRTKCTTGAVDKRRRLTKHGSYARQNHFQTSADASNVLAGVDTSAEDDIEPLKLPSEASAPFATYQQPNSFNQTFDLAYPSHYANFDTACNDDNNLSSMNTTQHMFSDGRAGWFGRGVSLAGEDLLQLMENWSQQDGSGVTVQYTTDQL